MKKCFVMAKRYGLLDYIVSSNENNSNYNASQKQSEPNEKGSGTVAVANSQRPSKVVGRKSTGISCKTPTKRKSKKPSG
jgi:hypothetical protein